MRFRMSIPPGAVTPKVWKAPERPSDCWDWLEGDDVLRHALAAFYAVCADKRREFYEDEDVDWREDFLESLLMEFADRLCTHWYQLGLPDAGEHKREAAKRLQLRALDRGYGGQAPHAELAPVMPALHQSAPPALVSSTA